jgi:hypothetical protein
LRDLPRRGAERGDPRLAATFFNDDWYFLLQRPRLDGETLFAPHNGHLSALCG